MLIHFHFTTIYSMCQYLRTIFRYMNFNKRNLMGHDHSYSVTACEKISQRPLTFSPFPVYHNYQKTLSPITDTHLLLLRLRTPYPLLQLPLEWTAFSSYQFYL